MNPFLEDEVIRLRALEPEDSDILYDCENDTTHWLLNGMGAPLSRKLLQDYAEHYDADPIRSGQLRLIAVGKESGEPVGIADLYNIDPAGRTAWIGIYIMKSKRGNGFASHSITLLERYAGGLLGLRALGAKVAENNLGSMRLFLENGFEKNGRLPDWIRGHEGYITVEILTKAL